MNIKQLARKNIQALTPYQSARRIGGSGDIWLNANEFPHAPFYQLNTQTLNRYPQPQPHALLAAYARYAGVNEEQIIATRGADEAIELLIRTFCEPNEDAVLYCPPTYGMYGVSAETFGIERRIVPLKENWQLDIPAVKIALPEVKLVYVCSPNNPTGNLINPDDLRELLAMTEQQALVIVDEAYIEFCPEHTLTSWLNTYPNLVILRTLSKAFALAGLRCGFALAQSDIIQMLLKTIAPYPIPMPVADIAEQALSADNRAVLQKNITEIVENRQWFAHALPICECVDKVFDSNANWLLVRFHNAENVFQKLSEAGIVVRNQSAQPGLDNCLRITIGTLEECQKTLAVLCAMNTMGTAI